jgi:ankyrin repeat protein
MSSPLSFIDPDLETELTRVIELQDSLSSLTPRTLPSVTRSLISSSWGCGLHNYRIFGSCVLVLLRYADQALDPLSDLLKVLFTDERSSLSKWSKQFLSDLFSALYHMQDGGCWNSHFLLAFRLVVRGVYGIDEIIRHLRVLVVRTPIDHDYMIIACGIFAPELEHHAPDLYAWFIDIFQRTSQILKNSESVEVCILLRNWNLLRANNYQLLKEQRECGHVMMSAGSAIHRDDLPLLRKCAEMPGFNPNQRITLSFAEFCPVLPQDPSLLEYAAFYGAICSFKFLLAIGADLSLPDRQMGDRRVIEKLAIAGGNIEIVNILAALDYTFTECLTTAVAFFRPELFAWLVHNKCGDGLVRSARLSSICSASAAAGNIRTLLFCIDQRCEINGKTKTGMSPLHCAIDCCRFAAVRLLLAHPLVKVNLKTVNSETPLFIAARHGLTYVVNLLLQHGEVDPNARDKEGFTALHVACEGNYSETVKLLLKFKNIDLNPRDSSGRMTPLHIAADRGLPDILKVLLAYNGPSKPVEVNARDRRDATALMVVAEVGNGSCAKILLAYPGLELNAQDADGKSALHCAAEHGGGEVLTLLLATKGLNVNIRDRHGQTALHYGVRGINNKPDIEVVKALLKVKDIDLTVRNVHLIIRKLSVFWILKVSFACIKRRWKWHRKRDIQKL